MDLKKNIFYGKCHIWSLNALFKTVRYIFLECSLIIDDNLKKKLSWISYDKIVTWLCDENTGYFCLRFAVEQCWIVRRASYFGNVENKQNDL